MEGTSCCPSLHHLSIILEVLLIWVPDQRCVLQHWVDQALVAARVNYGWVPYQVRGNEGAGLVGFSGSCVDLFFSEWRFSVTSTPRLCSVLSEVNNNLFCLPSI